MANSESRPSGLRSSAGDAPDTRHAPASVFADFVPPSFTASARREALETTFRRVTIPVPNSRHIVVNTIFGAQGFKPASDLMVMGEYRLLSYKGIGPKVLEPIQNLLKPFQEYCNKR